MFTDYLLKKIDLTNVAAPGVNTNITTALTPIRICALRITVALATGSVFNVIETTTATTTATTHHLNGGVALTAACLYTFAFGASPNCTYAFQVATDGTINKLQVEEIQLGVI